MSAESVTDKLSSHRGQLMSTARCKEGGWIKDPNDFYAATVCGISPEDWKDYRKKAMKLVPELVIVDRNGSKNGEFKGGKWFYIGSPPPNLVCKIDCPKSPDFVSVAASTQKVELPDHGSTRASIRHGQRHLKRVLFEGGTPREGELSKLHRKRTPEEDRAAARGESSFLSPENEEGPGIKSRKNTRRKAMRVVWGSGPWRGDSDFAAGGRAGGWHCRDRHGFWRVVARRWRGRAEVAGRGGAAGGRGGGGEGGLWGGLAQLGAQWVRG